MKSIIKILNNMKEKKHTKYLKKKIDNLYRDKDYLEAYTEHTNIRIEQNPHKAIGGKWDEIGQLQFDFLTQQGLKKKHKIFDIGCGTLRGGRHFIKYLDPENYTGIDISDKAIQYAIKLVENEKLASKMPRLLVNKEKELTFSNFGDETFDYILAQSVFTHLKHDQIETCFKNIGKLMTHESAFFFTSFISHDFEIREHKNFEYPISFFRDLASDYNFFISDLSEIYKHPRGQRMFKLTKGLNC